MRLRASSSSMGSAAVLEKLRVLSGPEALPAGFEELVSRLAGARPGR